MLRQSILLAALAGSAALFGGAMATPDEAAQRIASAGAPALTCEITAERQGGATVLTGKARAASRAESKGAAGDFRFTVTSRGPGGASRSAQNGTFRLRHGETAVLGEIGFSRSADYEASLVLTADGEEVTCRAES